MFDAKGEKNRTAYFCFFFPFAGTIQPRLEPESLVSRESTLPAVQCRLQTVRLQSSAYYYERRIRNGRRSRSRVHSE